MVASSTKVILLVITVFFGFIFLFQITISGTVPAWNRFLVRTGCVSMKLPVSYDGLAITDAKNAYVAAQAYFYHYPTGSVSTTDILSAYGFRQGKNASVVIPSGTQGDLTIVTYHSSGDRTYTIHSDGAITND
jgi:hypothetical protein